MPLFRIELSEFINPPENAVIIDVRSESEYQQGHIPGAVSYPLMHDEERVLVGTCYKQQGAQKAVELGYKLVGPRFYQIIRDVSKTYKDRLYYIYCFRGGLRSRIFSFLLESAGLTVYVLQGGYKNYRRFVLHDVLQKKYALRILGGFTGTGKTQLLQELRSRFQIIDIELLAQHKGSSFGHIGMPEAPTQEQFENNFADALLSLNCSEIIWVEDENRTTGKLKIPDLFYETMRTSEVWFLEIPKEKRIAHIVAQYGANDKIQLEQSTFRLKKRLGDLRTREIISYLQAGNMELWASALLDYYDKTYTYGLKQRNPMQVHRISETEFRRLFLES